MARPALRLLPGVLLFASVLASAHAQDCAPLRHEGSSVAGTVRLQGEAGRWYGGWLHEAGRELRLQQGDRLLAAAPSRQASLPLWLQADDSGGIVLPLGVGEGPPSAPVNIVLHCVDGESATWSALLAITRLAAEYSVHATPSAGWRMLLAIAAARQRLDETAERRQHFWLQQQLVWLAMQAGFLEVAAAAAQRLAAEAELAGEPTIQALALLERGRALLTLDLAGAAAATAEAVRLFEAHRMPFHASAAYHEGCLQQRLRGELEAAIACYHEVAERYRRLGEPAALITVQTNLVTALFYAGRYAEGRRLLGTTRELLAEHGMDSQRARIALLDSQLATWSADFDRAIAALFQAREVFVRDADPRGIAQVDRLLGHRYTLAGEPGRALAHYRRARKVLADHGLQRGEVQIMLHEARSLAQLNQLDEASQLAAEAETRARTSEAHGEWHDAILLLAELAERRGDTEHGVALLDRLSTTRLTALQDRRRLSLMAALQDDTALGEAVLRGWLDADLAERRLGEALRSASLLVERLVKRGADDEAAALVATVDRQLRPALLRLRAPGSRNALLRDLHALHALRSGRWQAGPVEASLAETLLAALDGLVPSSASTAEGDGVLLELERRIGDELLGTERSGGVTERDRVVLAVDLAWSNAGNSAGAALWQPRSGAVVVQPVMQRDRGGLLVGRDGGWRWIPVDLPTLRATRNELHALIAQGHAEQSTLDVLLTRLATALAAPQWLSGRNEVFIVAHAEFAGLPIEWLRQAITGEASRISWLHRLRGAQTLQPRQLAILGAAADRSHALASLAEVADETSSVRAIWNDLLPTTQGVSRDALHDALTIPGALVHVAAHGRSADWREEEAGLWMQDAVGRPAFVSALRLRRSNVASAVVVLSACDTGYSAAGAAFGFGGVASALVEAGAGAVIATRWPVGDRSARLFAEHFHRALRDSPTELEAALALAVEALRRAPATRHPTHWAGWFVLRREPPETRGVNDAAP